MELPDGWIREYEGRHGAEYFYEPRTLTVSVLPRYATASGRASEKDPDRYVVRVHRLFGGDTTVPVTLGTRPTYQDAVDLAEKYMDRVGATGIRTADGGVFEAFIDVANYDDDVLLMLCRSATGAPVNALVHVEDGTRSVAHSTNESPDSVTDRLRDRIESLAGATAASDRALFVATSSHDLVWLPRNGGDGTLIEIDDGAASSDVKTLYGFLDDIARYVRRRPARKND